MIAKAFSILVFVLTGFAVNASAADTLVVIFDRQNFVQGDSIEMEVYTEPFRAGQPAQTLHLWIDNIKTGQRWKFRYPFVKGRYKFSIKINDSIPNGTYAFNFLLQKKFLAVKGKLKGIGTIGDTVIYFYRKLITALYKRITKFPALSGFNIVNPQMQGLCRLAGPERFGIYFHFNAVALHKILLIQYYNQCIISCCFCLHK